jgi:uncharacterized protein DUF6636
MKRTLLVALATAATVAAPAAAKTVEYKNFVSPSKQIRCLAVKFGGKGIECYAPYIKEIGELDTYYGLEPRGKAFVAERGDFPGYPNAPTRTLHYGDTWKRNGITCKMKQTGLTCHNRDDHGFHLAKGDVRRF